MQDDIFPAAEKILSDIENVVKKNPSLKAFEIVPAEDNENKSPVFHQEDCLGLASWCVQPLCSYAYRRLFELRQNKHRREEPSTIAKWLLGALLLNPDVTTFWNMRRELVRNHKLEVSEEFAFSQLVLYHKPKCFEAFAYRRWLLSYVLNAKDSRYDFNSAESPLCTELNLVTTCADRYANNYDAWSHRRHVMTLRESRGFVYPTFENEWKNTLAWCQRHISDYSGLSYRQFLLQKYMFEFKELPRESLIKCLPAVAEQCREELFGYIKSNVSDTHKLQRLFNAAGTEYKVTSSSAEQQTYFRTMSYWTEECRANESAICMYNDYEALWCHRRFLACILVRFIATYIKHSCRRDEHAEKSVEATTNVQNKLAANEDDVTLCHDFLVEAFRSRTEKLAELATKRDQHEKMLVERFFKFLRSIGFEIRC
ncbi:PREDICTED: protein prenyltransferase alpha subunit repeat-containing protein 1 [Dufourea novaeangliae]|uniref:Protein prenyltransferase alpha subunit repeat-containing protein 1 n=1 Tax=Dufourea novaeangliae TaxID=178035 RepID=A0A154P0E6_DUFNO|nr:PREDICTED: protein prenyltransferase alpha subunit repeat-containing protein 1 [Dufourea novaeangliae]KZC05396.1 Protein prenyltransferase alpha subunit repeat-containing protein 1 [Dufourea novaeangliae]